MMKIKNLFIYAFLAFTFVFTACNDKDDETTTTDDVWTKNSVSANKAKIEDEGIAMLDEMKAMENEEAMETNAAFVGFLGQDDPFGDIGDFKSVNLRKDNVLRVNMALADFNGSKVKNVFEALSLKSVEADSNTVQFFYDELVGVYTWTPYGNGGHWDYVETGDEIKFLFPSTEDGETNDASYTVKFVAYDGPYLDPMFEDNLPSEVSAELAIGTTVHMGYYLDLTYNSDGYPTKIETNLMVGDFNMAVMAENANNTAFDVSYSFTHGSTILLKMELGADGDWTEGNIEDHITFYKEEYNNETWEWVEVEVDMYDEWDYAEGEVWKVVTDGNTSFQAMNIKVTGQIDAEELGDYMDNNDFDEQSEAEVQAAADKINEYAALTLRFADTDEIVAMGEAYPKYKEGYYNYNDVWVEYAEEDKYYDIDMRFVFADGSKIDLETYFETGFNDLEDQIEAYIKELEETYGFGSDED
ncbi:MAG: hypothetical protein JEZ09_08045 [Salinivirgaceae bacterium]|nr:hypothetical protein [Salinivirgaceae bacterium]